MFLAHLVLSYPYFSKQFWVLYVADGCFKSRSRALSIFIAIMVLLLPVHLSARIYLCIYIYTHTNTCIYTITSILFPHLYIHPSNYTKNCQFTMKPWNSNPTPQGLFSFSPFQYFQLPSSFLNILNYVINSFVYKSPIITIITPFPKKNALPHYTQILTPNTKHSPYECLPHPAQLWKLHTKLSFLRDAMHNVCLSYSIKGHSSAKKPLSFNLGADIPC